MAAKKKSEPAAESAVKPAKGTTFGHTAILGRWFVRIAPMLCLLTILGTGLRALWQQALADPLFAVAPEFVTLHQSGTVGCDLSGIGKAVEGRNLLDPEALLRLRQSLEHNAWVDTVVACRRVLPNHVHTSFSVREPYAQVLIDGNYHRVTRDGVALPTPPVKTPAEGLPIIQSDAASAPVDGTVWKNDGIHDALELLELFRRSPLGQRLDVRIVQALQRQYLTPALRQRQTKPTLELLTADGVVIKWGEFVVEATDAGTILNTEKMDLLHRALEFSPELKRGNILDVRTRTMTCSEVMP